MTNICGHDRETLRWALKLDADVQAGYVIFSVGARCAGRHSRNLAYGAIHDPDKLATIITELLHERGVDVYDELTELPRKAEQVDVYVTKKRVRVFAPNDDNGRWFTTEQARAFALALLDAPNASVQDIERMIGAL